MARYPIAVAAAAAAPAAASAGAAGQPNGSLLMFSSTTVGSSVKLHMTRVDYMAEGTDGVVPRVSSDGFDCTAHASQGGTCHVSNVALGRQVADPALSHAYANVYFPDTLSYHIFQYEYNSTHVGLKARCQLQAHADCQVYPDCAVWQQMFYDDRTDRLYGTVERGHGGGGGVLLQRIIIPPVNQPGLPCGSDAGMFLSEFPLMYPVHAAFDSDTSMLYYGHNGRATVKEENTLQGLSMASYPNKLTYGPQTQYRVQGDRIHLFGTDQLNLLFGPLSTNGHSGWGLSKMHVQPNGTIVKNGDAVVFPNLVGKKDGGQVPWYAVSRRRGVVVYGTWSNNAGGITGSIDAMSAECEFCNGTVLMPRKRLATWPESGCAIGVAPEANCSMTPRAERATCGGTPWNASQCAAAKCCWDAHDNWCFRRGAVTCSVGGWLVSDV